MKKLIAVSLFLLPLSAFAGGHYYYPPATSTPPIATSTPPVATTTLPVATTTPPVATTTPPVATTTPPTSTPAAPASTNNGGSNTGGHHRCDGIGLPTCAQWAASLSTNVSATTTDLRIELLNLMKKLVDLLRLKLSMLNEEPVIYPGNNPNAKM